jgi:hypothetical protein
MPDGRMIASAAAVAAALGMSGCSGSSLKLPPMTAALEVPVTPVSASNDPPVEVYARVARGALKCWFGPEGSLKKTHAFHAKADPASLGGAADIAVHTREGGSSTHSNLRAFRITITPAGGGSNVEASNLRFSDDQSAIMIADVARWVAGEQDCSIVGTGGWGAAPAPPAAPAAATGKAKQKSRPKAKPQTTPRPKT